MTFAALATSSDVAAALGRPLTAFESSNVSRLLELASAVVRRYTRQTINQVVNDVVVLPGNWSASLVLPERPVTSVSSVTINGSAVTQYVIIDDTLFMGSGSFMPDYGVSGGSVLDGPAGSLYGQNFSGVSWQGPQAQISVTYTHGYAVIPDDIANEVAGMVAVQMATETGIIREKIGGYEVGYARTDGGAITLSDTAKSVLNFYRKRSTTISVATRK